MEHDYSVRTQNLRYTEWRNPKTQAVDAQGSEQVDQENINVVDATGLSSNSSAPKTSTRALATEITGILPVPNCYAASQDH